MATVDEFMVNYFNALDEVKSEKEKKGDVESGVKLYALNRAYDKKYEQAKKETSEVINSFVKELFDGEEISGPEFIKALSDVIKSRPNDGLNVLGMAFAVLQKEAETVMPFNPERYKEVFEKLNIALDKIIEYGVKNKIISPSAIKKAVAHEASMNEESTVEAATSENKNDKKADETATTEEVVEKNSSENKSKKEEIEKKKKESNERRARTKKWFNYDLFELENVKKGTKDWYRVTNRISKLFDQEGVQNFVNDNVFKMLIYENTNDFAIINEVGNIVLWFKNKNDVTPFTDANLFNAKWAEAHQAELKFTA